MKVTRSQALDGVKLAGLFILGTLPSVGYAASLVAKHGAVAKASEPQQAGILAVLGLGWLIAGGVANYARTGRFFPPRAKRSYARLER